MIFLVVFMILKISERRKHTSYIVVIYFIDFGGFILPFLNQSNNILFPLSCYYSTYRDLYLYVSNELNNESYLMSTFNIHSQGFFGIIVRCCSAQNYVLLLKSIIIFCRYSVKSVLTYKIHIFSISYIVCTRYFIFVLI